MVYSEYIEAFGAIDSPYDVRDYVAKAPQGTSDDKFPKEFQLNMCKAKNQHSVGSCTAHAMASIIEYFTQVQQNEYIPMSTGYIYGNRTYTDHLGRGYPVRTALKTVAKCGDAAYSDFSYNVEVPEAIEVFDNRDKSIDKNAYQNRITSYYRLGDNADIKYSLMHNGPVLFAMKWYKDAKTIDKKLVFKSTEPSGSHCMVIYGWNEEGWLIQNSWGRAWGDNGRAILPYDTKISEAWGVIDTHVASDDQMIIVKPNFWKKYLAAIINLIMRLFKK